MRSKCSPLRFVVDCGIPAMAEIFYCEFVNEKINAALKFLGN